MTQEAYQRAFAACREYDSRWVVPEIKRNNLWLKAFHNSETLPNMVKDILSSANLEKNTGCWVFGVSRKQWPFLGKREYAYRIVAYLTVDKVVKRYARLRRLHPELHGTVFHSTHKWFITQCERTGVPEHFTATLVGHHSARSANKLTYGLYSAGISDEQKREIVEGIRLPLA